MEDRETCVGGSAGPPLDRVAVGVKDLLEGEEDGVEVDHEGFVEGKSARATGPGDGLEGGAGLGDRSARLARR